MSWCETYVQGPAECARPEVEVLCCNKCRPYLEGGITEAPSNYSSLSLTATFVHRPSYTSSLVGIFLEKFLYTINLPSDVTLGGAYVRGGTATCFVAVGGR